MPFWTYNVWDGTSLEWDDEEWEAHQKEQQRLRESLREGFGRILLKEIERAES